MRMSMAIIFFNCIKNKYIKYCFILACPIVLFVATMMNGFVLLYSRNNQMKSVFTSLITINKQR